jgi:hypothetical protein
VQVLAQSLDEERSGAAFDGMDLAIDPQGDSRHRPTFACLGGLDNSLPRKIQGRREFPVR